MGFGENAPTNEQEVHKAEIGQLLYLQDYGEAMKYVKENNLPLDIFIAPELKEKTMKGISEALLDTNKVTERSSMSFTIEDTFKLIKLLQLDKSPEIYETAKDGFVRNLINNNAMNAIRISNFFHFSNDEIISAIELVKKGKLKNVDLEMENIQKKFSRLYVKE